MAGLLEPMQHHDRQQRADVQRGCRAVEADVGGDALRGRELVERIRFRDLMDEATGRENIKEFRLISAHRPILRLWSVGPVV